MQIGPYRETRGGVRFGVSARVLEDAQKTAKSAMTEDFTKRLQDRARADAKRGVYMSGACRQLQQEQMRQYVSPDRSAPMGQVNAAIQQALAEPDPKMRFALRMLDELAGNCSGSINVRPEGQTAEIRAANGEVIATYSSLNGGWSESRTKAENKFLSETAMVYREAYREARAEMKAAQVPAPAQDSEAQMDLRV